MKLLRMSDWQPCIFLKDSPLDGVFLSNVSYSLLFVVLLCILVLAAGLDFWRWKDKFATMLQRCVALKLVVENTLSVNDRGFVFLDTQDECVRDQLIAHAKIPILWEPRSMLT